MKLFFKKPAGGTPSTSTVVSRSVQLGYKRLQQGWVSWMIKCTRHFTRRHWLVTLSVFVLLGSLCCTYVSVRAFLNDRASAVTITRIKTPQHVSSTQNDKAVTPSAIEVQRLRRHILRSYRDSLARSPTQKNVQDSIRSSPERDYSPVKQK